MKRIFSCLPVSLAVCLLVLCLLSPASGQTYSRLVAANWGITGLTSLCYTAYDATGTARVARTSTGVTESPAGSGTYYAAPTLNRTWGQVRVVWDDGTNYAAEVLPTPIATSGVPQLAAASPALMATSQAIYPGQPNQTVVFLAATAAGTPDMGDAANITVSLSLDGGTPAASTNHCVELANGMYAVSLAVSETQFARCVIVAPASSTAGVTINPVIATAAGRD